MREVICVHVGQAGIQISNATWELFCVEHGIEATGRLKLNLVDDDSEAFKTFFSEVKSGNFVPRCVSIDLEPTVIDEIRKGNYRNLFNPDNLISGIEDGCNNFARGRFTIGKKYLLQIKNPIRNLVENCDYLQGFFIIHSQGGGTGSGFTSLLMESLSTDFTKYFQYQMTVFPSLALSTAIVEPYNSILSIKESTDISNITTALNNSATFDICTNLLDIIHPTYNNINRILSHLFSDITVSLRFESSINSDLSQLGTNLIPYPRIHFVTSSHSPMYSKARSDHELLTTDCLTRNLFRPDHQLITSDIKKNVYISCVLQFRGLVSPQDVNISLSKLKKQKEIMFVDWCPTGFKLGVNSQPPSYVQGLEIGTSNKSATMLVNGRAIISPIKELSSKFDILFARRSFIHWFVGEGMEEGEFNESRDDLFNILSDYEEVIDVQESVQEQLIDTPPKSRQESVKISNTLSEEKKSSEHFD